MKKILTISGLCILFLLVLSFRAGAQKKAIRVGDKLPGFYLKDLSGENFFLGDYVGEKAKKNFKAMIFSLSASYCKPCKKEIPELEKMMEKYKDKGLGIYLIAIEKEKQARKLVSETKTTIPVLLDKYMVVPKLLGNRGIPFTLLIDIDGTVRFINTGFSEKNAMEFIKRFESEVAAVLGIEKKLE